jgi:hypothetical protein
MAEDAITCNPIAVSRALYKGAAPKTRRLAGPEGGSRPHLPKRRCHQYLGRHSVRDWESLIKAKHAMKARFNRHSILNPGGSASAGPHYAIPAGVLCILALRSKAVVSPANPVPTTITSLWFILLVIC